MNEIEKLLDVLPTLEGFWHSEPASETAIATLELALGAKLPPGYVKFLKQFGSANRFASSIAGIIKDEPFAASQSGNLASLLFETRVCRERWKLPNHLLVFQPDGDAPYCFDTSQPSNNGEYPVVCFEKVNGSYKKTAKNFEDWLRTFYLDLEELP